VSDREAVHASAKYLRRVRPLDPAELVDYVEGTDDPDVVGDILREDAHDLRLAERADGTFVPAETGPAPDPEWAPESFPGVYADALEAVLRDRYGERWAAGETGDRLRETVRRLKADYYHENPVEYDADAAAGYAVYHLPDFYAAVGYVLDDLAERDLLPRTLRVLDVGAGVGGPALGLHDYLPDDGVVDYHAVEPSAAADVLEDLLAVTRRNFRTTVHRTTAEAFDPEGTYDLLLFGNVLSELDDPVAVVERLAGALADDGTVLALAPADRNTATGLRAVERDLARGGLGVYSPTLRLWPGAEPADEGWSFDVAPDLAAPAFQRRLDDAGGGDGEFVNVDVQFAYALLRPDGERRFDVRADPDRHAELAEADRHVTRRVDLLAVKLSHDLADGGNPVYRVGDGSERVDCYAVATRESVLNRDLRRAAYGAVLAVENVLVLWNDDEGSYNLVVDAETVVEAVAGATDG
jgi:SAM-dependent methyltransferase